MMNDGRMTPAYFPGLQFPAEENGASIHRTAQPRPVFRSSVARYLRSVSVQRIWMLDEVRGI